MRTLPAALLLVVGLAVVATPAQAACHAFTVRASPDSAAEGGKVTVTVARDAAVNPSSVDVSSVDVTAKGGEDFPVQKRTISFTAETQQSFEVPITDDAASEGDETFKLRLSNPGGCAVNPNFSLGPDATVTIRQSDGSGTTSSVAAAALSTQRPGSATTSGDQPTSPTTGDTGVPSSEVEATASTEASTASTRPDQADEALAAAEDGGGSGAVMLLGLLAIAALAGAAYLLYRRRAGGA